MKVNTAVPIYIPTRLEYVYYEPHTGKTLNENSEEICFFLKNLTVKEVQTDMIAMSIPRKLEF